MEKAALYHDEHEYCDVRDENYASNEEDESYYCEICDRDFHTEKLLNDHKSTHRVCGIEGCTFSAHPKLVEKHITMQHCTGLYHRMKNIKTPEDIEKWIAERKKKYPTKSNIEMKNAESLEKKERGEIIEQTRGKNQSSKTKKPVRERKRRGKKRKIVEIKPETREDEEIECCNGIQPFRGTNSLVEIDEETANSEAEVTASVIQFSDDDDSVMPVISNSPNKSILSLVADYGSDSDEPPDEVPIKKIKTQEPEVPECLPPSTKEPVTKETILRKEMSKSKFTKTVDEPLKPTRKMMNQQKRTMLLDRLLSRSIQHERNYICQCIKHIVDNNFFD